MRYIYVLIAIVVMVLLFTFNGTVISFEDDLTLDNPEVAKLYNSYDIFELEYQEKVTFINAFMTNTFDLLKDPVDTILSKADEFLSETVLQKIWRWLNQDKGVLE